MSENGWIKLHRKMLKNPIVCKDADHLAIWVYLLMSATHEEYATLFEGKKILLQPGQLVTGRKKISSELCVSDSKVHRVLKDFENEQQIEQQTKTHGRLITITNWNQYQMCGHQAEQQVNSNRTASEQQVNTIQEYKEQKNERSNLSITNVIDCEDKSSRDDIKQVLEMWNSLPAAIPKVQRLIPGKSRYMWLRARLREYSLAEISNAIENIRESDFLQGKNSKGWNITFDWFVRPNNFPKVLDGQYNNKAGITNGSLDDYMMSIISGGEE